MKTLASTIIAVILFACGDDSASPRKPVYQDLPKCLSCDYVPPEDEWIPPEPQPHLSLVPDFLAFYFTQDSPYPYPPEHTTLMNLTGQPVDVLAISIIDDESFILDDGSGETGDHYFTLTEIALPLTLEDGGQLEIEVSFSYSTTSRAALLVVETTFDNPDPLVVELGGKVFIF